MIVKNHSKPINNNTPFYYLMIDKNTFAPIWIKKTSKQTLTDMKVHKNQSYDEVVTTLIEKSEQYDLMCRGFLNDTDDGQGGR